jgi:hypothetical protein
MATSGRHLTREYIRLSFVYMHDGLGHFAMVGPTPISEECLAVRGGPGRRRSATRVRPVALRMAVNGRRRRTYAREAHGAARVRGED